VLEGGYKVQGRVVSPFARSVASMVRAQREQVSCLIGLAIIVHTFVITPSVNYMTHVIMIMIECQDMG
jgi:hypothetical protein